MSGHSKWSKVKHQKASTDVVKAALFTKASQAIAIAVKTGGGVTDPDANFHLRLAVDKAKSVNMPKENIERAIKRAAGGEAGDIAEHYYEGFGPGGTALLIQVLTDNPNRAVSQIKSVLGRHEGTLAGPGAVSHLFEKKGFVEVAKDTRTFDAMLELGISAGADDIVDKEESYEVVSEVSRLAEVKTYLERKGVRILTADQVFLPRMPFTVPPEKTDLLDRLIDELTALDDVVSVYTNSV